MPRKRLNWLYDDDKQQFTTPAGRVVSLHEIAQLLHQHAEGSFDFAGAWAGWRMRGAALIPPRSTIRHPHLKPHNLAAFLRWAEPPSAADRRQNTPPAEGRRLRLVYSSTRRHG